MGFTSAVKDIIFEIYLDRIR